MGAPELLAWAKQALEMLEDNHHLVADNEKHAYVMLHLDVIERGKALLGKPAEPEAWMRPNKWTLLLVGDNHGLVGKFGCRFAGHPEHYERVDVYAAAPTGDSLSPTNAQPAAPTQCWKCGDMDAIGHAKCDVPACGMKEQPEPVQERSCGNCKRLHRTVCVGCHDGIHNRWEPTTPPTQPAAWVGLTDEEVDEWTPEIHSVIRAIEAKLREKNAALDQMADNARDLGLSYVIKKGGAA
jgi:hypothetical protein